MILTRNILYLVISNMSLMNNTIPCIIIDDDQSAIDTLQECISAFPRLRLALTYTKSVSALNDITMLKQSHIIFTDIDMPHLSGINLAENLKGESHNIIFITSYPQYAIEAFKVRAKHYLLKPFDLSEFAKVVNDVLKECYSSHNFEGDSEDVFYFRKSSDKSTILTIPKNEIIYIQGSNNHIHLYTPTENHSVYMTIKAMEEKLKYNTSFFRVHKSYIINSAFVKKIEGNKINLGKYEVLMAAHYKAAFIKFIEDRFLLSSRT